VRRLALVAIAVGLSRLVVLADPTLPKGGLFKPTFLLADRSFAAGTAFTAQVSARGKTYPLLISCFHVLDGSSREIQKAVGLSMTDTSEVIVASKPLPILGARALDFVGVDGEISAFILSAKPKSRMLKISTNRATVGMRVGLYARLFNQREPAVYPGIVIEISDNSLVYVLNDPTIEIGGASGSPLLNDAGHVIGINVAGIRQENGALHVVVNPSTSFLPKIQQALQK
jgi:hypothetical protein